MQAHEHPRAPGVPDFLPQTAFSEGWGPPDVPLDHFEDLDVARMIHMRRALLDAVDHAIALLDAIDVATEDMEPDDPSGDPLDNGELDEADHEGGGDDEPTLGAPEDHPFSRTFDMKGRLHKGRGRTRLGDQTRWAASGSAFDEEEEPDGEPEAGYDLPEGDDERDGSEHDGCEPSIGWPEDFTAKVDHAEFYHSLDDEHDDADLEDSDDDADDNNGIADDGGLYEQSGRYAAALQGSAGGYVA